MRLEGKEKVIAWLKRIEKNLKAQAAKEIQGAALRTVAKAKMRLQPEEWDSEETRQAVVDVRQSINHSFDKDKMTASVHAGNVSKDNIAAYLEFGTGPYAERYVRKLSPVWQKYAMTFYVNGKGRTSEHPYLVPSFEEEKVRLSDRLKGLKPLK